MLHMLHLILNGMLLPFSWEVLDLIQWTQTVTLLFSCLPLCESILSESVMWRYWAFQSTANSMVATNQLRSFAYTMLRAVMPCFSTLMMRRSRSTTSCRKEEGACSLLPDFPAPHCWDRIRRASKPMRLQLIILVSDGARDLGKYTDDTIGHNKVMLEQKYVAHSYLVLSKWLMPGMKEGTWDYGQHC